MTGKKMFQEKLARLKTLVTARPASDFLLTWEKSDDEIRAVVLAADILKTLWAEGVDFRFFRGGLGVSIFRDNSTRTRYSFAAACNALGLGLADLDEEKSQIAHGETVRETANMISFLTEVIGIRDDIYLGRGNAYMREVAAALDEGYREAVLPQRPAIVNLQCDLDHPTQTVADLCYLESRFGSIEALAGKRIAMSWAYSPSYGKPLSVPQGIIALMTRFGMDVVLAHPEGYGLVPEIEALAEKNAARSGGRFTKTDSMDEAFEGAHIVYPKSWAPYEVMEERTRLLESGDRAGLEKLEARCLERNARFDDWECDAARMARTREGKALYMHCLPADITAVSCAKGEVSADVFEAHRLETYREAGFKPFVIAAMILLARADDPAGFLEKRRRSND